MAKENVTKASDTVITHTGEIVSQENVTNIPIGNEPQYFKVYTDLVDDLGNICKLNISEKSIFLSLAKNMSFNNTVVLLKQTKLMIMEETGIKKLNTINKAIDNLYKQGFIIRQGRSVYTVNPNLVGKGKWEDNKALRLTIEYSSEGRHVEVVKVNSNTLQLKEKHSQLDLFTDFDNNAQ